MMEYRIDKKGNKLSVLGLGCMRFPKQMGKTDLKASETLVLKAIESGINYFDTAYIYGDSEEVLGKIIEKNNIRDKMYIATKLPMNKRKNKNDFEECFNTQLKRLKTDYIDYYLMHMLTDLDMWNKLCEAGIESWIAEKKERGQINQIGFSFHGSQGEFLKILDAYDWDFCQIQYNYMNENYQAGKVGLIKAYEKGIPVIIMEPLLGGKLANGLPKKALETLKKYDKDISPATWALNWLWNQKEVTSVLSGMTYLPQLADNVKAASASKVDMLTDKEVNTINKVVEIFNESYKIPCTGCNYCMPCPQGVNIPACFSSYNAYYAMGKIEGLKQYAMSVGITSEKSGRLTECIDCGICEKKCPQNIEIRKNLKLAGKKLEPFYIKTGLTMVKKYMNKRK